MSLELTRELSGEHVKLITSILRVVGVVKQVVSYKFKIGGKAL